MIGTCITASFGLKWMSEAWNANGGMDNFYQVDGTKRGQVSIALDAVKSFNVGKASCEFMLNSGSSIVFKFPGNSAMKSWMAKEKMNLCHFNNNSNN